MRPIHSRASLSPSYGYREYVDPAPGRDLVVWKQKDRNPWKELVASFRRLKAAWGTFGRTMYLLRELFPRA